MINIFYGGLTIASSIYTVIKLVGKIKFEKDFISKVNAKKKLLKSLFPIWNCKLALQLEVF
jgi:hypothetical protein